MTQIHEEGVLISKIHIIRGQKVMIDQDLAFLYEIENKRLNEQVRRNPNRFPPNFCFELTKEEFEILKSQIATSSWGGRRKLPHVFTEHGVLMLSSVLNSQRAIDVNIQIMRLFTKMRELLMNHKDLILKMEKIEQAMINHDQQIGLLFEYTKQLLNENDEAINQENRELIGYK